MAGPAVLPREAIAFLRAKRLKPSRHWLSVWREEHAAAFTVAQMTGQDLLRQTHREVQRVLRRGETVESFQERLQPWLEKKGWAPTGRGGNLPTRLRRIYHTNLRTAHLRGKWDRIQQTKELLPWLVYGLGPSDVHREQHAAWAGLCLRVDDPFWRTHYPPNGWGCKCWVRQVAEPPEGARTEAPRIATRPWTNPATGETVHVPVGIDPGWDYNPGEHAGLGTVQALTDRLRRLTAPAAPVHALPGRSARSRLLEIVAPARRRVDEARERWQRAHDAIQDPTRSVTSAQLRERNALRDAIDAAEKEVVVAGRRAIARERPAPFHGEKPEVDWQSEALENRWGAELDDWRRMVAPALAQQRRAPRVVATTDTSRTGYVDGVAHMNETSGAGTMVHELSHLLEADRGMLERAVAFLRRRTRGDPIEVINDRGDRGRRDEFRDVEGKPYAYPGRIYEATAQTDAGGWHRTTLGGDVDVYATEILSMGMEWMWTDPLGFAAVDPDYFDFIWDTVVRSTR